MKTYRTRADQRPPARTPVLDVPVGDNIDRIAGGVRLLGYDIVHRRDADGRPACGTGLAALYDCVQSTHPVTCANTLCAAGPA